MTIEQLAIKVMSKLGVYDRSNLDPADLENVRDAYACLYLQLKDDALVTWGESDDVPTRFTLPIIALVAAELAEIAPYYNISEPQGGWDAYKLRLKNGIRRQLATGQDPEPVAAEYF